MKTRTQKIEELKAGLKNLSDMINSWGDEYIDEDYSYQVMVDYYRLKRNLQELEAQD